MYRRNDTPAVVPTSGVIEIIEATLSKKWYRRPTTKKIEEISMSLEMK
jgi:hypothetical protein